MQLAVEYLESLEPQELEKNSAASLILKELRKQFRCPKKEKEKISPAMAEAIKRAVEKEAKVEKE
jgi:hypothetical protein